MVLNKRFDEKRKIADLATTDKVARSLITNRMSEGFGGGAIIMLTFMKSTRF